MNRNKLIQLIHVAKKQLALSDENYRSLIGSIKTNAYSCTHLNLAQLDDLYKLLKKQGFKAQKTAASIPNKAPKNRSQAKASLKQLHYIRGLWTLASRQKDEQSLNRTCYRMTGIQQIQWLDKKDATKLILALRSICAKQGYNPDSPVKIKP